MNHGGVCLFSMSVLIIDADVVPVGGGCERRINYHPTRSRAYFHREIL